MNWELGVVPLRPWPRSWVSEGEVGFSSESESGDESRGSEEEPEGQSVVPGAPWRGSHIVSNGASKNASRYVEFAVRTSNGVFPVPTTVTGLM